MSLFAKSDKLFVCQCFQVPNALITQKPRDDRTVGIVKQSGEVFWADLGSR